MAKDIWINLPVKDINKSVEFFKKMEFRFNTQYGIKENSASLLLGEKNIVVMLFEENAFENFSQNKVADTLKGTEVLISFDAQSKEEVDEIAKRAVNAGGTSNHKPSEMKDWMYGCLFTDPDGHRWNVLYMDMNKMSKD